MITRKKHLKIEEVDISITITPRYSIKATHLFNLGILQFMLDINESVERPNRYLHALETNLSLQTNFVDAIEEIFQN